MNYTSTIESMCPIARGPDHNNSPIPLEGNWVNAIEVTDISGFSNGVGTCAPHQGATKVSINVKNGVIEECLIETVGCSGMTHSAAMASEILTGRTILQALNTDLVCDAINVAMREVFKNLAYGRSQTAYSENGLPVGAGLDDLGKGLRSQVGTSYGTQKKGARYLEIAEGYVKRLALNEDQEIIGYEIVNIGQMMSKISEGLDANEALNESTSCYGRFQDAVTTIDPRKE
ncbi:iron-sulfur cluster assembly scaffold protein [Vibrio lentus]|uniref:NIF system FeS cluster assembly NifU N-terminal domain-containing protein n=1 Tax=Vibrio lentus TaxID=136468 RepID=A0AB36XGT8_9VIBR|nr:hypothetical protein [Vibrio lentus]MCC4839659.1 hypothetical protein [Vibrio lentus]PMI12145.1 hypothetical protein BCU51_10830 [Vibrio lentus]PMK35332.1 hypothetical protein BCU02_15170 [Vibrio lentus]PMK42817.1 hypothetical protein BCT99_25615 [Vibrio lentus]PML28397.1 hypothetical protein BCT79_25875 [Vibrio lentus]